jgi:hypothetical protein
VGYFETDVTIVTEPPQPAKRGFRRSFAELSLEKKLSIFFVPVFAAVLGTLVPRFLGGGGDSPGGGPASIVIDNRTEPRSENLQVVDLLTLNSRDKALSFGAGAELRVLVRNTGTVDSLIHSAEFDVVEYEEVELCAPPEGEMAVTGTYELVLPSLGEDGLTFDVDLQQGIPAGEPDVFSFNVRLDEEYEPVNGDSRLYVLEAFLRHDLEQDRVPVGRALLALPFPGAVQFAYPSTGSLGGSYFDPECPARNRELLERLLGLDAEHSDELELFAADPAAAAEPIGEPLPDPTQGDVDQATAAAGNVVAPLAAGDASAACAAINETSALLLENWSDLSCADYVAPLTGLASAGAALTLVEAHPGWMKLTAPPVNEHQLVVLVQITSPPGTPAAWEVTNLYDTAVGPLHLNGPELYD